MTNESLPKKKRRISICVGCGGHIQDQYILRVAPDLEWHASCLKCSDCSEYLDESNTCFVRDSKTYCKRDYLRLFGTKCTKCTGGFSKSDFVMRAKNKIYHIDCFRCVACSRQLIPGDEFALREDGLFCKIDHEVLEKASNGENNNNNNNCTNNNNSNGDHKGLQLAGHAEPMSSSSNRVRPHSVHKSEHKTTRVRTVLNEKQLHTLRTCYNANPRPDALMKEQLVEMTNLSPRVIRVWFQNKRCKDKKRNIMMKQMAEQQAKPNYDAMRCYSIQDQELFHNNGGRIPGPLPQGVPMVASSPVRHEGIQGNPVEVQSYQPPWKALSEFAMQSEMDQPPFQQLVNSFDQHHHDEYDYSNDQDDYGGYYGLTDDDSDSNVQTSSSSSDYPLSPQMSSPLSQ